MDQPSFNRPETDLENRMAEAHLRLVDDPGDFASIESFVKPDCTGRKCQVASLERA